MTNPHFITRRKRGFTLTELLVVVLVIAVLAAIAMFATQSLRGKGNAAKSVSNLRQLFTGHQLYLAEYGHFPSGNDWTNKIRAEAEAQCKSWHERLAPYVGLGSSLEDTQKLFVKDQLPPGVFEVPGRKRLVASNGGTGGGFRSGYMRNNKIYMNDGGVEQGTSFKTMDRFDRQSATFFLIDAGGDSASTDFNGWQIDAQARLRWPAHGGATGKLSGQVGVCFLDGHVELRQKSDLPVDWRDVFWQGMVR